MGGFITGSFGDPSYVFTFYPWVKRQMRVVIQHTMIRHVLEPGYKAWQTSMEKTKMSRVILEGSWLYTIFCFVLTHCVNYVMKVFYWFVPPSVNNCFVLCTVKDKNANKNVPQRT